MERGFKARANRIAVQVRCSLDLAPTDPLDPFEVCDHFEICVLKLSSIQAADGGQPGRHLLGAGRTSFSALTMPVGGQRVIVHNDSHSDTRQRSNIAHELAHCFLGHPLTPPLMENGDRARHSGIEEEAAFLGASLLIPNEAARHISSSGMTNSEACARYRVSQSMLTYRLRVSGAQRIAQRIAARSPGLTNRPGM